MFPNTIEARMKKIFTAFTLAETLITLVIIGIIAAMTVPTMIQNKEKQETVSRLKKIYTIFAQAFELSAIDNGHYSTWYITSANYSDGKIEFEQYLKPYLKISEYCGSKYYQTSAHTNKCFPYIPKGKDGSTQTWGGSLQTFFTLDDGTNCAFVIVMNSDFFKTYPTSLHPLFLITVDINGQKPPNAFGKDIFQMQISPYKGFHPFWDGLVPSTSRATRLANCNANVATEYGDSGCLNLIMMDGWQIKDDYTW